MKKRIIKTIAIFFLWLFIISIYSISIVEADTKFYPGVPIGTMDLTPDDSGKNYITIQGTASIAKYVQAIYQYGLSIGAILATVVLMAAGVVWLTSGGNQSQVGKAKEMITGSLVGLFLLFGSWFILNTINPALVNLRTPGIKEVEIIEDESSGNIWGCCLMQNKTTTTVASEITRQDCYNLLSEDQECKQPSSGTSYTYFYKLEGKMCGPPNDSESVPRNRNHGSCYTQINWGEEPLEPIN